MKRHAGSVPYDNSMPLLFRRDRRGAAAAGLEKSAGREVESTARHLLPHLPLLLIENDIEARIERLLGVAKLRGDARGIRLKLLIECAHLLLPVLVELVELFDLRGAESQSLLNH